jgi:outer membrane protein assembly factor BamE (lipoprotein component of BamABCDE complex)
MKHVAISIALLLACCLLQGCVAIPASGKKVTGGTRIENKDVAFIKIGETTRSDIIQSLGTPTEAYSNSNISVYWWSHVAGYGVGLPPFSLFTPFNDDVYKEIERDEFFLVQFDDHDLVRKFGFRHGPIWGSRENFIINWARQDQP